MELTQIGLGLLTLVVAMLSWFFSRLQATMDKLEAPEVTSIPADKEAVVLAAEVKSAAVRNEEAEMAAMITET